MERKIGEEFYCKGKTFKAVEVSFCLCEGCDLGGIPEIDDDADTIHCIHSKGKEEYIATTRE